MWAVGRLSLLSRGQARAVPPVVELGAPLVVPPPVLVPAKTIKPDLAPMPISVSVPTPVSDSAPLRAPEPAPPAVESPGMLQLIVNRVSRLFRSLFG